MDALMDEAAAATRRDDAKKRTKDPKPTGLTPNAKHGRPVGLATYAPTSALEQNAGSGAAASLAPDDEAARPTTPVESDDETTLSVQARWVGAPSQTNRLVEALDNVRALQAHLSTPDVLVLSCAARGFDAFATPPFWRELFERDWPGVGPALVSGAKPRDVARLLAARGVWRSAEASLITGPRPPGKLEPPTKGFYEHRPPFTENVPRVFGHDTSAADRKRLDGWRIRATLNRRRLGRFNGTRRGWNRRGHHEFDETLYDCVGLTGRPRFGGGCSNWETQVLFPFTTGFGRGPAWKDDEYVRAFDDEDWEELDYDSYLSEDGPELGEALRANSNSDDWYSSTPKRTTTSELRLDVDLVRRSDGALVRLASGTSAWQDMADVGYEAVWEEMVLTNDPFCRLHARGRAARAAQRDGVRGPHPAGLRLRSRRRTRSSTSRETSATACTCGSSTARSTRTAGTGAPLSPRASTSRFSARFSRARSLSTTWRRRAIASSLIAATRRRRPPRGALRPRRSSSRHDAATGCDL